LLGLNISANRFNGTLPSEIGQFRNLRILDVSFNQFSGFIPPDIGNITHLIDLRMNANPFVGSLPKQLRNLLNMTIFSIAKTSISGTFPNWLNQYKHLKELTLAGNRLFGTLPDNICECENLNVLVINSNTDLFGTLPDCLGNLPLYTISVFGNHFSGALPQSLSQLTTLVLLFANDNNFDGTIPTLKNNVNLSFICLKNNKFSGNILGMVNSSFQTILFYVDLTNNQFSGPIDTEIFQLKSLISFAAVDNCFTGSIPQHICELEKMTFLNLDGMHTASSCRHPIFPDHFVSTAYFLSEYTTGGIPECLFSMPKIETLHLSGNGIKWSFPDNLTISETLNDLCLSHNLLTGMFVYLFIRFFHMCINY
jgi:hypothetical protein